jgi:type IV pilus assembly protein PilY1
MNRFTPQTQSVKQRILFVFFMLASCLSINNSSFAVNLGLVDVPMDVQEGVPPNLLLTVDDSGSMSWFFLPDSASGSRSYTRGASSEYNKIYYNPAVRYVPGVNSDGSSLGNSNFNAAWGDGYNRGLCTANLETSYRLAWYGGDNCGGLGPDGPAYYYVYDTTQTGCTSVVTDNSCYRQVVLDSSYAETSIGGPDRTDCATPTACTLAEEQQNFANWYSYYRSRTLLAKTAAGRAFSQLTGNLRTAHQTFHTYNTISLFRPFISTARQDFFTWLYGIPETNLGTPLRQAFVRGGNKFTESGLSSPYAEEPGVTLGTEYSCRQNFQVMLTDGYWNGGNPTDPTNFSPNFDNTNHTLPETSLGISSYTASSPYSDNNTRFLADYALYYWVTDLRGNLTNNVPTYIQDGTTDYDGNGVVNDTDRFWNPVNDPANWQHMVSFTIGLGIDGTLAYNDTTYQNLINGTQAWTSDHVDDLWHGAINGRGQYFNANNPTELVDAFSGILNAIAQRIGSSSAPAPSAPRYEAGTKLYQPVYDTSDWHGDLRRFDVTDLLNPEWETKDILNTQDYDTGRKIISYDPINTTGIPFRWASLNADQQALLTNNALNYLRGDKSNEQSNGGSFRNRTFVLGDIVNSEPVFVGPPQRLFPDTLESAPYSTFMSNYSTRAPMVWVGANDGMLHAFNANTGYETLAFVPSKVYDNLSSLTSTSYSHKFFVDGSPIERDAFYGGAWHTVLVGGLNKGGQEIYALDITNPAAYNESNAANLALWEFTDANDPDLGYTFSTPQVAKMNNGQWMAVFGNGYNNTVNDDSKGYCTDSDPGTVCPVSSTGNAVLYILDVQTGGLIRKLNTLVGMAQDPTGNNRPNGLSSVTVVDVDGNYTVDYIYAGDLFGNLWKFDVTDVDPANWKVVESALGSPAPLFVATDAAGNHQPITSAPVVGVHTSQAGYMVNFGTGKYLELTDLSDTSVQTFYGIWDRDEATVNTVTRAYTQEQTITQTTTSQFGSFNARVTSDNTVNWYPGAGLPTSGTEFLGWRMDLVDQTGSQEGERVISKPQRRSNRIIFVTNIPSPDPCLVGGTSWIMELNAVTGQRLQYSPFDYNNDGVIDYSDMVQANFDVNGDGVVDANDLLAGSGIQDKTGGKLSRPTILLDQNGNEVKLSSASNASLRKILESGDQKYTGRRSWIQLLPN